MTLILLHGLLGAILFGAMFADVFFLRSAGSQALEPRSGILSWRRSVSIIQMVSFLVVVGLGLAQWMPNMTTYPAGPFHGKLGLAVVFLVLGKIRMFKERKSDAPTILLTRLMFACVVVIFTLGLSVRLGGIL